MRMSSLSNCYISFLAIGSQGKPQSHTTQQASYKRVIGKGTERGNLYSGKKTQAGDRLKSSFFREDISRVVTSEISDPELGASPRTGGTLSSRIGGLG